MKKLCYCILMATGLWACGPSTGNNKQQKAGGSGSVVATASILLEEDADVAIQTIFDLDDAERILGEPARLSSSSTRITEDTTIIESSYTAKSADKKSGKTGNVYFMHEEYKDAATAHDLLAYYQKANEQNGAQTVTGIGDEAWFHTDGENFYFMMARKGNSMIRLKVNKITANTSPDLFNTVAKEVVEKM